MLTELLSRRALIRATLARQRLLHRGGETALEMVEHLVGLNAQDPDPPYVGLWSRIADEHRRLVFLEAAVTVDGLVRGVWRVRRADGTATVVVRLFTPLTGPEQDAVGREGMRLARFVAPDLAHDVRLVPLAAPWPDSTPWDCSGMAAGRGRGCWRHRIIRSHPVRRRPAPDRRESG